MKKSYIILGKHRITGKYVGTVKNNIQADTVFVFRRNHRDQVSGFKDRMHLLRGRKQREDHITKWMKMYHKRLDNNVTSLTRRFPDYEFFIARAGSAKCPVRLHWKEFWENRALDVMRDSRSSHHGVIGKIGMFSKPFIVKFSEKTP